MAKEKNIVSQLRQDRKILWIAVTCGIVATLLVSVHLQKDEPAKVAVLIASKSIPVGGTISYNSVKVEERPANFVPARALTPDYLDKYGEFNANLGIEPGELILWSYVKTGSETTSIELTLNSEYDMRLITIPVDEVKAVAGHIEQNDLVDILWTGSIPTASNQGIANIITKVLLEKVTVATVGSALYNSQQRLTGMTSITLKLSQDEAALLAFAESVGEIRLIRGHQNIIPEDIKEKKESVEINFENIKKSKTISTARQAWIDITYGRERK